MGVGILKGIKAYLVGNHPRRTWLLISNEKRFFWVENTAGEGLFQK